MPFTSISVISTEQTGYSMALVAIVHIQRLKSLKNDVKRTIKSDDTVASQRYRGSHIYTCSICSNSYNSHIQLEGLRVSLIVSSIIAWLNFLELADIHYLMRPRPTWVHALQQPVDSSTTPQLSISGQAVRFLHSDAINLPSSGMLSSNFYWVFQLVFPLVLFHKARCLGGCRFYANHVFEVGQCLDSNAIYHIVDNTQFCPDVRISASVPTSDPCHSPQDSLQKHEQFCISSVIVCFRMDRQTGPTCCIKMTFLPVFPLTFIIQSDFRLLLLPYRCIYPHLRLIYARVSEIFQPRYEVLGLIQSHYSICVGICSGGIHRVSVFVSLIDRPNRLLSVPVCSAQQWLQDFWAFG